MMGTMQDVFEAVEGAEQVNKSVPFPDRSVQSLLKKFKMSYVGSGDGSYSSMSGWSTNYYFAGSVELSDSNKKMLENAFLKYEKDRADPGTHIDHLYYFMVGANDKAPGGATARMSVRYGRSISFGR